MSAKGLSIPLRKIPNQEQADEETLNDKLFLGYLFDRLWDALPSDEERDVLEWYTYQTFGDELRLWDGGDAATTIIYSLSDAAGLCGASAEASLHWYKALFMIDRQKIQDQVLLPLGYQFADEVWGWAVSIHKDAPPYYIKLRGKLWSIWPAAGDDKEVHLHSDYGENGASARLPLAALTRDERKEVIRLVKNRRCGCSICEHLVS